MFPNALACARAVLASGAALRKVIGHKENALPVEFFVDHVLEAQAMHRLEVLAA